MIASVIVAIMLSWLIAGYFTLSSFSSGTASYSVDLGSAQWISAPDSGRHSWFRTQFVAPAWVSTAVLWIDSPDTVTVYVDGRNIPPSYPGHLVDPDVAPAGRRLVDAMDLSKMIAPGAHSMVLEVVSRTDLAARVRARLAISGAGHSLGVATEAVGTTNWRATSDARELNLSSAPARVSSGTSRNFSGLGYDDSSWGRPVAATGESASQAIIPPEVLGFPRPELGLTSQASDVVFEVPLLRDKGTQTWAWARIWANGAFTLSVNGAKVTASPLGAPGQFTDPLGASSISLVGSSVSTLPHPVAGMATYAVDVGHWLHEGSNTLRVHLVGAQGSAEIFGDVLAHASDTTVYSLAESAWRVRDGWGRELPGISESSNAMLGTQVVVPTYRVPSAAYDVPGSIRWGQRAALTAVLLVAVALCAGLVRRRMGLDYSRAYGLAVWALAPAGAGTFLANGIHAWHEVSSPIPYTGVYELAMVAAILAGFAGIVGISLRGVTRPASFSAVKRKRTVGLLGRMLRRIRGTRRVDATTAGILLIAVLSCVIGAYRLGYEAMWQDELSSLAAARGMREHIIPQWPSGFIYFKSELYSTIVAVVGAIFGDQAVVLRMPSVLLHGATVVLFGRWLLPLVMNANRRWLRLVATAIFAIAPAEMVQARDVRMYQLLQFLAVALVIVLLHALRNTTRLGIWSAAALLVAMYLAHEVSFCLLPVIPIIMFAESGFRWFRERRWLIPILCAGGLIAVQFALAKLSHPPAFGSDASGGPFVRWQPDVYYYLDYVTRNDGSDRPLLSITVLAVIGFVVGIKRSMRDRIYFGLLSFLPLLTLSLLLPAKEPRYVFVMLPFMFALAVGAVDDLASAASRCAEVVRHSALRRATAIVVVTFAALGAAATTASGIADYGVAVGDAVDVSVPRVHWDYDYAGAALKDQISSQDILVAAAPANLVAEYFGRTPDYWLPHRANSRMLYLIEKNDQVVDTQFGIPVLFSAHDMQGVLNRHRTVWLVMTTGLVRDQRDVLSKYFQLVENTATVMVFRSTGA